MKLVTSKQMRAIEAACVARGIPLAQLMEYAGEALAHATMRAAPDGRIVILAGPGNNGGDGVIAASVLTRLGRDVLLYTVGRASATPFQGDVVRAGDDPEAEHLRAQVASSSAVVDALLGIGQSRPVAGELAAVVATANAHRGRHTVALAADVPTGVDADSGRMLGTAFRADVTICMGLAKLGVVVNPGAECAGVVQVADVGIPVELSESITQSLLTGSDVTSLLPIRKSDANKGTSGRLLAVSGSRTFTGAPALLSLAAYRAGAGLVELAVPETVVPLVAAHALECIFLPLAEADGRVGRLSLSAVEEALPKAKALVLGSGLGLSDETIEFVRGALQLLRAPGSPPAVVDADGLNALAQLSHWCEGTRDLILTPHPGEMSRLTGLSIPDIQHDRIDVARRFAQTWRSIVVLKGARTVIASPTGEIVINESGGPNLATAGTGDVLTGIIGGLLAQGLTPWHAARCGAYLHGRAGDLWRDRHGDVGMLASDLLSLLPDARTAILSEKESI